MYNLFCTSFELKHKALQSVKSIEPLESTLKEHGITYTKSKSGRAALFFRDPDQNVLEMAEQ